MKERIELACILMLLKTLTGLTLDDFLEADKLHGDDENSKNEHLMQLSKKRMEE